MRARPALVRILLVVAVFAFLFGAAEADVTTGRAADVTNFRHSAVEVSAPHDHGTEHGLANANRLRRVVPFDAVLGTVFFVVLWLSWPCATRKFRARALMARFSIRRRGPPALLAAA